MTHRSPWVRRGLRVSVLLAVVTAFICGGSAPTPPLGPSERSWDDFDPAPDQWVEPTFRTLRAAPPR